MKVLKAGSLFSGCGGIDLGFERAGFKIAWQVEIEPFARKILKKRFPKARRFADVAKCWGEQLGPVDVITAGVPCQDVSIAGKRAGLAGERTGLFYHFARILQELRPAWFVFENVPGLFSSNAGRDFAEVQRVLMVECGYGVQWRVLDSRFFGVAQRRKRLFIVGCFGKPCPPEILFEPESCSGNFAPGGKAWPDVADTLGTSADRVVGKQGQFAPTVSSKWAKGTGGPAGDECQNLVAATLNMGGQRGGFRTEPGEHIIIQDVRAIRDKKQHGIGIRTGGPVYTLDGTSQHAAAGFNLGAGAAARGIGFAEERSPTLRGGHGGNRAAVAFTPVAKTIRCGIEGKHAQPSDGRPHNLVCAPADSDGVRSFAGLPKGLDSARYRALGNAVTVNVAEWIARRLKKAMEAGRKNG